MVTSRNAFKRCWYNSSNVQVETPLACSAIPDFLIPKSEGEYKEANIGCNRQRRKNDHDISAGAKPFTIQAIFSNLREKLSISLLPAEETYEENAGPVDSKQCTDTVELGCEYFQNNKSERKLRECRPDICSFKCALCCSNFDKFLVRENN